MVINCTFCNHNINTHIGTERLSVRGCIEPGCGCRATPSAVAVGAIIIFADAVSEALTTNVPLSEVLRSKGHEWKES